MYTVIPSPTSRNEWQTITVQPDGTKKTVQLRFHFVDTKGIWNLSIYDPKTGACMAECIPLLSGLYPSADILGPFGALGIGSACIVPLVTSPTTEHPSETNFGTEFVLVWGDRIE